VPDGVAENEARKRSRSRAPSTTSRRRLPGPARGCYLATSHWRALSRLSYHNSSSPLATAPFFKRTIPEIVKGDLNVLIVHLLGRVLI
jgi:hypothetical protein